MFENVSLALQGIWGHKLRSVLTMLGIIIGIASIITIVSTIRGTNEQIKQNLIGQGSNVVNVYLMQGDYAADLGYSPLPDGVVPITEETRASLDELDGVKETSLYCQRQWTDGIYYKNAAFNGNLLGVDSHYLSVNDYGVLYGRSFVEEDFSQCRKVVILDAKAAKTLFNGENPIGHTVEIQSEPFTVIGVVSQKNATEPTINSLQDYWMYADSSSGTVLCTLSCWGTIYRYDEPQSVAVRAHSTDDMTRAGNNVATALNDSQITIQGGDYSYKANDLLQQASDLQSLSESANSQLIWIAGISLLVGGIGVMNIMLVSVTERTREIGLKIAIGARQKRIMWQFLTEAGVLTSIGGLLGVAVGIGLAYMLSRVMGTPVAISVPACLIAVAFSMVIGVVFGLMPAVKASKLNPIEALRRE